MPTVHVSTPGGRYAIYVQRGLVRHVAERAQEAGLRPSVVAVIADDAIEALHGAAVQRGWELAGVRAVRLSVRAREEDKSLQTVEDLCAGMLDAGIDRRSAVVAVGGGVVGDAAGLVAALYMRGISCIQVPTTLLAMVDASVGGKTAVNLSRRDGSLAKNMIGAFWQPSVVVCDPETLGTLDARELRCGLAECVKHAVIADPSLLDWMLANADSLLAHDPAVLETLVARNVAIKAGIVSRDEREQGERALLNLGHTFAHAIEAIGHERVKHGEAVAIGLVAATHLAAHLHGAQDGALAGIAPALARFALPVRLPQSVPAPLLMAAMKGDKKSVGGALRLVVPHALGDVRVHGDVPDGAIEAAWRAVGAD